MKTIQRFILMSALTFGVIGCTSANSETDAADARTQAAAARVDAADANARVTAADAQVRAADARVKARDTGDNYVDPRSNTTTSQTPRVAVSTAKPKLLIPSGTALSVALIDALGTDSNSLGDHFLANLTEPVVINGITMLQRGSKVRGRVVSVEDGGRVKGLASIQLELTDIVQGERFIPISTDTFGATADASKTRDGEIIGGGAGIGAVIGGIVGGKEGAAIGAATGGGAGTAVVLGTKGKQIHYDSETLLNFTLANSVQL
jgi:hypothetical protein